MAEHNLLDRIAEAVVFANEGWERRGKEVWTQKGTVFGVGMIHPELYTERLTYWKRIISPVLAAGGEGD